MTLADREPRKPPVSLHPEILLFLVISLGTLARLYHIKQPLLGLNEWRMCDTAAVTRNFYEGSMDILYPQIDWRGNSPGYVESEFPIYQFLVATLYRLFGPHDWLGRLFNVAVYSLSAFLLVRITRLLFNDQSALLAVLFYSVVPLGYVYTRSFQPDVLMAFASLASVYYFLIWTEEGGWVRFVVSALATSTAVLIKPTSLYLGLPLLYLCHRQFGWRLFDRPLLWLYSALVLVPAMFWYSHAWSLWQQYGNTFGVFGPGMKLSSPKVFAQLWRSLAEKLLSRLFYLIATPAGIVLLLVGSLKTPRDKNYVLHWWVVGFGISVMLAAPGHEGHDYYQLPILFVTAAWMGCGTVALWDQEMISRRLALPVILALLLLVVGFSIRKIPRMIQMSERDRARASFAAHVKELTETDALIIFVRPTAPFWHLQHRTANGEYLTSEPVDFYLSHRKGWSIDENQGSPEFIDTLRKRGARYFATFYPQIFARHPEAKIVLDRCYAPVEVTEGWAIYRLDAPSCSQIAPR